MQPTSPPGRPRATPRRITVQRMQILSPQMRRVTFAGADLSSFAWSGPAAHLKLIFPLPGQTEVETPAPDGPRPAATRTYTPRRFDAAALTLDVDFVLHGEGPASNWAEQVRPGQQLVMMGPGPGHKIDPDAAWHLLVGDDTALPAIETLLEALPAAMPVTALIEVVNVDERRALPGGAGADLRWLPRGTDPRQAGVALLEALSTFQWPSGDGRVYVGCEAQAMRRVRNLIAEKSGLARQRIVGRGYWRIGAANHPDRDFAED